MYRTMTCVDTSLYVKSITGRDETNHAARERGQKFASVPDGQRIVFLRDLCLIFFSYTNRQQANEKKHAKLKNFDEVELISIQNLRFRSCTICKPYVNGIHGAKKYKRRVFNFFPDYQKFAFERSRAPRSAEHLHTGDQFYPESSPDIRVMILLVSLA